MPRTRCTSPNIPIWPDHRPCECGPVDALPGERRHRRCRPPRPVLLLLVVAVLRDGRARTRSGHRPAAADGDRRAASTPAARPATTSVMRWRRWWCSAPTPGSLGLVSGVGMHMTKHIAAVYSTDPGDGFSAQAARSTRAGQRADRRDVCRTGKHRHLFGGARSQTVPQWGLVVVDLPGGESRAYGRTEDPMPSPRLEARTRRRLGHPRTGWQRQPGQALRTRTRRRPPPSRTSCANGPELDRLRSTFVSGSCSPPGRRRGRRRRSRSNGSGRGRRPGEGCARGQADVHEITLGDSRSSPSIVMRPLPAVT